MKRGWLILMCALLLVPTLSFAGDTYQGLKPGWNALTYEAPNGVSLPYQLYLPEDYDRSREYPLILFMHGNGSRGTDNKQQINNELMKEIPKRVKYRNECLLLAPQEPVTANWVDTDYHLGSYTQAETMTPYLTAAKELLFETLTGQAVDPKRVYIVGCSMGAYAAWDLTTRFPELFAALVAVAGSGDPAQADKIKDLPVRIYHGDADTIVPMRGSQEMYDALLRAGSTTAQLTIYPDVTHSLCTTYLSKDAGLLAWLFEQARP